VASQPSTVCQVENLHAVGPAVPSSSITVPRRIKFSGTMLDSKGDEKTNVAGVT